MTRYVFRQAPLPTLVIRNTVSDGFRYADATGGKWVTSDGKFSNLLVALSRTCLLEYALMGWVE